MAGHFANQLTLKSRDYSGLSEWAQQRSLKVEEGGSKERQRGRWQQKARSERCIVRTPPSVAGSEDGEVTTRNVGWFWKLKKARK